MEPKSNKCLQLVESNELFSKDRWDAPIRSEALFDQLKSYTFMLAHAFTLEVVNSTRLRLAFYRSLVIF